MDQQMVKKARVDTWISFDHNGLLYCQTVLFQFLFHSEQHHLLLLRRFAINETSLSQSWFYCLVLPSPRQCRFRDRSAIGLTPPPPTCRPPTSIMQVGKFTRDECYCQSTVPVSKRQGQTQTVNYLVVRICLDQHIFYIQDNNSDNKEYQQHYFMSCQ